MAYKSRSTFNTDTVNIKTLNIADGKIDAVELTEQLNALSDSAAWEDQAHTISSGSYYYCVYGNLQKITLSANINLIISDPERGKYYTLIKTSGYTITLPSGQYSNSGSTTGTGRTIITFLYDGTNLNFSFSTYSAT